MQYSETAVQRRVKLLQKDTRPVLKLKINNKCIDVILSSITAVVRQLIDNTNIERIFVSM